MEDETLIRRIRSGDTGALDELIRKYYGGIYAYCCRRLGDADGAQDVTQEVFLHFCRNFDSYAHRGKCRNYLYVIARNLCINAVRKKVPIPWEDADFEGPADAEESRVETADSIRSALDRLPEEQKEVVLLRFYHDCRLRDIARIMGSGLSVTKYRLRQGLSTLRRLLPKEDWL